MRAILYKGITASPESGISKSPGALGKHNQLNREMFCAASDRQATACFHALLVTVDLQINVIDGQHLNKSRMLVNK
jgi:hypothetical protein